MIVLVAAAVIVRCDRVLVTKRRVGSHFAGKWEFPGGKVKDNEPPRKALERELAEEIGVRAVAGDVLDVAFHQDDERSVVILFFDTVISESSPEPTPVEVSAIAWRCANELTDGDFPPADVQVLSKIRARLRATLDV